MSTLQQPCPTCKRQLELPTSALGRLAKCPACDAVFTVTVSTRSTVSTQSNGDLGQLHPARTPTPTGTVPPTLPPSQYDTPEPDYESTNQPRSPDPASPEGTTSAVYLEANPFCSPLDEGMAAHPSPYPYGPPNHADDPVAEIGSLRITPRPIEEVFSTTFAVFGDRCGLLILAFLLSVVAAVAGMFAPVIVLQIIADAGNGALASIGFLVLLPLMVLFGGYIGVGLARNALAIARNLPAPMSQLIPPMGIVVRFIVGAGVITASAVLVGMIIGGFMSLVSATGNNDLVTVATVIVFFATSALSAAAYWLLWSWLFIVSDGKGTAFGSMRMAIALTMHNKTTSLLLVIVSIALSIVGTMFCYIGHLITVPLTMLLFAVAYLLMTNQQVCDPRIARQQSQNSPLGPSPF